MGLMYTFFRNLLFRLDPETAHALSLNAIRLAWALPPTRPVLRMLFTGPARPVRVFDLDFPNPTGLAAGYDKDGLGWRGLSLLGFGHIEVGTVTLKPQEGNRKPRLFRLKEENALINRMGFPGKGAEYVAQRLKAREPGPVIVGVNIGKNRATPLEEAASDYAGLFDIFAPLSDYLAINVSSPNTEGLRRLQARRSLDQLLSVLASLREEYTFDHGRRVPLLVKLAPDLNDEELDDALDTITGNGMDGVIATNTTIRRDVVRSPLAKETGGLSGEPLFKISLEMVKKIYKRLDGRLPVVGVGGISNVTGAQEMLDAGAVLIQLYTGLVYQGPGLVKKILKELRQEDTR
jgi:dihydroorotate dehydrogenase